MLVRLIAYWALGVDAIVKRQYALAGMCFAIPFTGPIGIWIAALAGFLFAIQGYYLEGAASVGVVIFNLVGNYLWDKMPAKKKLS